MKYLKYEKETPEFLVNYLKFREFVEFKPSSTVDSTFYDIRTFFRFLKLYLYDSDILQNITKEEFMNIDIKDITIQDLNKVKRETITEFLCFLCNTLDNDVLTRNRKLTSLKNMFKYFEINNYIGNNPSLNISKGKINKRLPQYLSLNESKKLLSSTIKSNDKNQIRNYAIVCLFLNTGIRLSELVGIDITDIKFDEMTLKVLGKGSKERIIYLDDSCLEALKEYLKIRPKLNRLNKDYYALFLSSRKERISKRSVQNIITNERNKAFKDTKDKIHTHSLRHTCATLLWDKSNADTLSLKAILGHNSIESTSVYTHVSDKKLKEIMETKTISVLIEERLGGI